MGWVMLRFPGDRVVFVEPHEIKSYTDQIERDRYSYIERMTLVEIERRKDRFTVETLMTPHELHVAMASPMPDRIVPDGMTEFDLFDVAVLIRCDP